MSEETVRLHVKVLFNPDISIDEMISSMKEVYHSAGINVEIVTTESLNSPELVDLEVGSCMMGSVTNEQVLLFNNRNSVGPRELVVYFVRSTIPPLNGCAAYPTNRPGAVITRVASRWTLAHEIGHVLGLRHVNDNNRLMTGNGTHNITNPPPDLISSEVETMIQSEYTIS